MPELKKAILQEIKSDESRAPIGPEVPVQFNPTSLKLALSNQIEGGRTRSRQTRQYIGSSSSVLSLELVFDTADEGTTEVPRSVEEKTNFVERFVLPKQAGTEETPPKLRFSWGQMIFEGIVEKLDIDFDHFAADGTPLRAKVSLSMKEQDAEYQFLQTGPGAAEAPGAREPGAAAPGAPGSSPGTLGDRVAAALGGETAAEFAARVGLDPGAWRGLGVDLGAGLSLEAGLEVGFSANLGVAAGVGIHVGVDTGVGLSVEAAFGLESGAGGNAGAGAGFGGSRDAELAAGFALSAAGGVDAALNAVQVAHSGDAARASIDAFGAAVTTPASAADLRPSRPEQTRTPLMATGTRSPSQQAMAPPAPDLPRADQRARSFGFGAPLRPRIDGLDGQQLAPRIGPRRADPPVRFRTDPTKPPWVELPAQDAGRATADAVQTRRRPKRACNCQGPCRGHAQRNLGAGGEA